MKYFTLVLFQLLTGFLINLPAVSAQECGSDLLHQNMMQSSEEYRRSYQDLEQWTKDFLRTEKDLTQNMRVDRCGMNKTYTIPVVVHVLHLGEAVGTGSNISDQRIKETIESVNKRFAGNDSKSEPINLRFELAKRDANGKATTGIVRVDGRGVPSYISQGIIQDGTTGSNSTVVKDLSIWPRDRYYNIWVVHDIYGNGAAAYAHYPTTYKYEGAVMDYRYMTAASTTLTHELGHAFNLPHTFDGDSEGTICPNNANCETNGDFICDTPPHKRAECGASSTCGNTSVYPFTNSTRNFMSYCGTTSLFTPQQRLRMKAALFSNTRFSLVESDGLVSPVVTNDIEVESIRIGYNNETCDNRVFKAKIFNRGTSTITSAVFSLTSNLLRYNFTFNGNISPGGSFDAVLSGLELNAGNYNVLFEVVSVNGMKDDNIKNDFACETLNFPEEITSSICYNFESEDFTDSVIFGDWEEPYYFLETNNNCNKNETYSIIYDQWNIASYTDLINEMTLPSFYDENIDGAAVVFDRAYAQMYSFYNYTTLAVGVSANCGESYTTLKSMSGTALATTKRTLPAEKFVPQDCSEWKTDTISFDNYVQDNSVLRFQIIRTSGIKDQPIYFDNICVLKKYRINVSVNAAEGNVTGAGLHYEGSSARLSAVAKTGYIFEGWYDNGVLVTTENVYKFDVYERRNLTARFKNVTSVKNAKNFTSSIYPNPGKETVFLNIQFSEKTDLRIIIRDIQGRILLSENHPGLSGNISIPLSLHGFSKGLYIVEVHSPADIISHKLMKIE